MSEQTQTVETVTRNGIDVTEYENIVRAVKEEPALAKFQFRARNVWDTGGYNCTTISGFYGAGEEHGADGRRFVVAPARFSPVLDVVSHGTPVSLRIEKAWLGRGGPVRPGHAVGPAPFTGRCDLTHPLTPFASPAEW